MNVRKIHRTVGLIFAPFFIPAIAALMARAPVLHAEESGSSNDVRRVSYVIHIHPIMEKRCFQCHGRWFPKGGLRLISAELVRKGGRSGPVVVPGSPEKSLLVRLIRAGKNARKKMPPKMRD